MDNISTEIEARRLTAPRPSKPGVKAWAGSLIALGLVAGGVIAGPRLLLADEPTGNLHSQQGEEIMRLFRELNRQGTTIVQVTHSETNAAFGNRVVRLRDGWIEKP